MLHIFKVHMEVAQASTSARNALQATEAKFAPAKGNKNNLDGGGERYRTHSNSHLRRS